MQSEDFVKTFEEDGLKVVVMLKGCSEQSEGCTDIGISTRVDGVFMEMNIAVPEVGARAAFNLIDHAQAIGVVQETMEGLLGDDDGDDEVPPGARWDPAIHGPYDGR